MRYLFAFFLLLVCQQSFSIDRPDSLRLQDWNYHPERIKSIQLGRKTEMFSDPIIRLNTENEILQLDFDDLEGGFVNYYMNIVHCNADWTPSDLFLNQYYEGLVDLPITQFSKSINTRKVYTHYKMEFPNADAKTTVSGNFILYVYRNGDRNDLVLSRRFMVYESTFALRPYLKRTTKGGEVHYKQGVDLDITTGSSELTNPFDQVKVVIRQNARWDNASTQLKPLFVQDGLLRYQYEADNIFDGCNEFRRFDTRTVRYKAENIASFGLDSSFWHFLLLPSMDRSYLRYSFYQDMNGKYVLGNLDNGQNPDIDADYVWVDFSLPFPDRTEEGEFYLLGDFNSFIADSTVKMKYNPLQKQYETRLFLKQGLYNFLYGFVEKGKRAIDTSPVEGMHEETENNYDILVYYSPQSYPRMDRLAGYIRFNTLMNPPGR